MKLYSTGRYKVQIGEDGSIKAREGDMLSGYSYAVYGNFWRINNFGRLGVDGRIHRIMNVIPLHAGDIIYHIPTYTASRHRRGTTPKAGHVSVMPPPIPDEPPLLAFPPFSEEKKKEIIADTLEHDFNLSGEHLHILIKAIRYFDWFIEDPKMALEFAGLIAEGGVIATAGAVISATSFTLFAVEATIEMVNAYEMGVRMFGMRGVAYAATAWAFDHKSPEPSKIIPRIREEAYRSAWAKSVIATQQNLESDVTQKGVSKYVYQSLLRAAGDNNPKDLALRLMKGFEKKLPDTVLHIWQSGYRVEYPD